MKEVGNGIAKAIYECGIPTNYKRDFSDQFKLEQWIRNKYEKKKYLNPAYDESETKKTKKKKKKNVTESNNSNKDNSSKISNSPLLDMNMDNRNSSFNPSVTNNVFAENIFILGKADSPTNSFMTQQSHSQTSSDFEPFKSSNSNQDSLLFFEEEKKPKIDTQRILSLYNTYEQYPNLIYCQH